MRLARVNQLNDLLLRRNSKTNSISETPRHIVHNITMGDVKPATRRLKPAEATVLLLSLLIVPYPKTC